MQPSSGQGRGGTGMRESVWGEGGGGHCAPNDPQPGSHVVH